MKHIKTFEGFLNESSVQATPESVVNFIKKEEKHFAAFLKPKKILTELNGDIVTIEPGSGSFTITIDFKKQMIDSTGKPKHPESTSYVEIMEYIKKITKFVVNNAGY